MPERDAEVWVTSKESTYTVELVSNGGTFNYNQDNKMISTSESTKSPTELSYVHYYTDDWTLPWVDSSNKTKVKNPDIINQNKALVYRDGYTFMGWSLSPVDPAAVLQNAKTYEADFDDTAEINYTDSTFKDKAAKLKESYKDKDISLDFNNDKGEVRLYAVWCPTKFIIRYHSECVSGVTGQDDFAMLAGKTYDDTNNGKYYDCNVKKGTVDSVKLLNNDLSRKSVVAARNAFGMTDQDDFVRFRAAVPKTGPIHDADESYDYEADLSLPDTTDKVKRIKGYDSFAIGLTVKNGESLSGDRDEINGTYSCPSGIAAYADDTDFVSLNGKMVEVAVVDVYCEYTQAIKTCWKGNSKYLGCTLGEDGSYVLWCHYGKGTEDGAYIKLNGTKASAKEKVPDVDFQAACGNTLKGWSTDPTAIMLKDTNGDFVRDNGGSIKRTGKLMHDTSVKTLTYDEIFSDIRASGSTGTATEITYFAQWDAAKFKVRFDGNKATAGSMSDQAFEVGEEKGLSANQYKNSDFAFVGWRYIKANDKNGKEYLINSSKDFAYDSSNKTQAYIVPKDGYYYIECWGADGEGVDGFGQRGVYTHQGRVFAACGGKGGYTAGMIYLTKGTKLDISVGKYAGGSCASIHYPQHPQYDSTNEGTHAGQKTSIKANGEYIAVAGGGGSSVSADNSNLKYIAEYGYAGGNGNNASATVTGETGEGGGYVGKESSCSMYNGSGGDGYQGGAHSPVQPPAQIIYVNYLISHGYMSSAVLSYNYGVAQGGSGFTDKRMLYAVTTSYTKRGFVNNPAAVVKTTTSAYGYRTASNNGKGNDNGYTVTPAASTLTAAQIEYYREARNGYCRISQAYADQEKVSAESFAVYNNNGSLSHTINGGDTVYLSAIWADTRPSVIIGEYNVPGGTSDDGDMEEYYKLTKFPIDINNDGAKENVNLHYDVDSDSGGVEIVGEYDSKSKTWKMNYKGEDFIFPDLSLNEKGEQIHDGFLGWLYTDPDTGKMKISRTATLTKAQINKSISTNKKFIYKALWADHYAVSLWDINHQYSIDSISEKDGKPQYGNDKAQADLSGSDEGITFGAALGYNGTASDGSKGVTGYAYNQTRSVASNDFYDKYVRHGTSSSHCIHRDYINGGWALIAKNIADNGYDYYSECLTNGCTVPVFFAGNGMITEAKQGDGATLNIAGKKIDNIADDSYSVGSFTVNRTQLFGDTGLGDGCTEIVGTAEQTSWQTVANGGTVDPYVYHAGGHYNLWYDSYDKSNVKNRMGEIYNAILNPYLSTMIGGTDIVYATNSKALVKSAGYDTVRNSWYDAYSFKAPASRGSDGKEKNNFWWNDSISNGGWITDALGTFPAYWNPDRTYNGGTSVQAYTYGIAKDQKLFIPSAKEIYGDCSQTRGGDAYVTLYNGKYAVGPHTEFVLDYLDGNQFEKFKNYSFVTNLFNARSYSADLGMNKDTARLNSANQYGSAGIVTRTPGSSNTRARTTSISDEGGLNTACYTYGNNGLAPCFRVDKTLAKKVMISRN